jgi:hypothetical protein
MASSKVPFPPMNHVPARRSIDAWAATISKQNG